MLVLLVIMGMAVFLRFEHIEAIEHNIDHAAPIVQALGTLERGHLPLTGQETSVLFDNPALAGYLYLPVLMLWRSPVAVYLLVITLNTAAVWLAYRAVRALFDPERALIAAALVAVNPWVIEYSRATWVQGLVPFFVCLVAALLWPVLTGESVRPARDTIAALAAMTALTQIYLPAFVVVLPVGVLLILYRKRVPRRAMLAGGLIFIVATGVYLGGLLGEWDRTRARVDAFIDGGGEARLSFEAWEHAGRLVTGLHYPHARGVNAPAHDAPARQTLSDGVGFVLGLVLLLGGAVVAYRREPGGVIALVWFAVPLIPMTWVSRPVHPFYLLVTLPAGHALAGLALGYLLRWQRALLAGGVLLALLLGLNSVRYYEETRANPGDFGLDALPIGEGLRLGAAINEALEGQPARFLSIDIDTPIASSLCGRLTTVSRDQRFPALTRVLPWPGGVTVVFDPGGGASAPVGAVPSGTIAMRDGTAIHFYQHMHSGSDWPLHEAHRVEVPTDRGLTLAGWRREGELLVTYWRVDSLPPDYGEWLLGPAVHVYDAGGSRVAVFNGEAVPGYDWRLDQLYIQQIAVPDAAHFEIGLYDAIRQTGALFILPGGERVPFYRIDPAKPAPGL